MQILTAQEHTIPKTANSTKSLRACLRDSTRGAHDLLDTEMRATGWGDPASYRQFLQIQLAARASIEAWLESNSDLDKQPPFQCDLIRHDLTALGHVDESQTRDFSFPEDADPIGLCWALAGSSLGNLAILKEIERNGLEHFPHSFLSDPAMRTYWSKLRIRLEHEVNDADAKKAVDAARAVFDHFREVVHAMTEKVVAA